MSYIGYSDKFHVFTKIISDIVLDKETDILNDNNYLKYYNKICDYLNLYIDENDLIAFINCNKFPIIKAELMIYNLNNLIEKNVEYKQRLHKFISNNIRLFSKNIVVSILALLFDDFLNYYKSCILSGNNFYISLFGMYISLEDNEFLQLISSILEDVILDENEFYFLLLFLSDAVDFTSYNKYIKNFIDYYSFHKELGLQKTNYLSIVIYEIFRIDSFFSYMWEDRKENLIKNKEFLLNLLNLLISYHLECKCDFLIKQDNENIETYFELIYKLLISLFEFEVDDFEYKILLDICEYIILDDLDFESNSIKKIRDVVSCILKPYYDKLEICSKEELNISDYNKKVILLWLFQEDYIYVLDEVIKFNLVKYEFVIIILKLIFGDMLDNRVRYLLKFNETLLLNIDLFSDEEIKEIVNYMLWILKDILKYDNNGNLLSILLTVFKYSTFSDDSIYELINIIFDIKSMISNSLIFDGKSFYNNLLENSSVIYCRLDREYAYAKNIFTRYNSKILDERDRLIFYLKSYLSCSNRENREKRITYYSYLLTLKYFDLYKFEIKSYFEPIKYRYNKLKSEISFLIYDAIHEEGFKLGIILSLLFKSDEYIDVYKSVVNKVSWGDIFYGIYQIYGDEIVELSDLMNHSCYIFRIKFKLISIYGSTRFKSLNKRNAVIREKIFEDLNAFTGKLNSYVFIYSIIFSDYYSDKTSSINILTLNLKTILKLINEDLNDDIIFDSYIYYKFRFYISLYCNKIISYTQIQTLDHIIKTLRNKFFDINKGIVVKEIENDIGYKNLISGKNIKSEYNDILYFLDKVINGVKTSDYYDEIFYSENIELITSILNSEKKFYNKEMELFYSYIETINFFILDKIYLCSLNKPIIAKVFIKVLNNYPIVLYKTLNDNNKFYIYKKIVEINK